MIDTVGEVYKKGRLAARLSYEGNQLKFEYLAEYLSLGHLPVATTLPLSDQPLYFSNGASPAFFAGLLPEGRRLSAITNRLKVSLDNDLAVFLEIGADLIGDVQVLGAGAAPTTDRESLKVPRDLSEASFAKMREEYFGLASTGLPGFQDKVSSKMLNARARLANVDYILKFNPQEAPFAVENEAMFLGLANACGIETAKYKLLTDGLGERALLLERFDRVATVDSVVRLAAEDGCQTLNLYPANKYDVDFDVMAQRLISNCAAKPVAGFALFKQLVFNWLIGNGDSHAKNFSILESIDGSWRIAPAYDLLCTRFYDDRQMALAVSDLKTGWTREFLIESAARLLVPQKAAVKVIDHQLSVLQGLSETIRNGALPFRRDQNLETAEFLKKRYRSLAD